MTGVFVPLHVSGPPHAMVDAAIGVAAGFVVVALYYLFLRLYVHGQHADSG